MRLFAPRIVSGIWVLGVLLATVIFSACGTDPIPEYDPLAEEPQQRQIGEQVAEQAAEQAAGQTAEQTVGEAGEPETDANDESGPRWEGGRLRIRLEGPTLIYPMPGTSWQALEEAPAGTELSIDSRYGCGENVWLRLLLFRGDTAWIRLQDSGLTEQDVEWLAEASAPFWKARLRWDRIAVELGVDEPGHAFWVDSSARLLGRSADSRRVAIQTRKADGGAAVYWVKADSVELEEPVGSLPIYIGECCVHELPRKLAMAEIVAGNAPLAQRPHGQFDGYELKGGDGAQFPIVGRTADGKWIALRVRALTPNFVWTPIHFVSPNVDSDEIPILIASGTEALSADSSGEFGVRYAATDAFRRWGWLGDGTLVGTNDDGAWHWDPETGVHRRLTEADTTMIVSPDGRYVVSQHCADATTNSGWCAHEVAISAIDSAGLGEPVSFPGAYLMTFDPRQPRQPYPSLMWAPDSLHLIARNGPSRESGWLVLSVNGTSSALPVSARPRWLSDSTLLVEDGQKGFEVYGTDGTLLRSIRFERADGPRQRHSTFEPMMVVAGQPDGNEQLAGFYLIDLATGELDPLPAPLDHIVDQQEARPYWAPLLFSGDSIYFYRWY